MFRAYQHQFKIDHPNLPAEIGDDDENRPFRRSAYTREHKLAAIQFATNTYDRKSDGTLERVSRYYVSKRLRIHQAVITRWIQGKNRILATKRVMHFIYIANYIPPNASLQRMENGSTLASNSPASPKELEAAIQSWLQFNRRNTVIRPDSDCGIYRGIDMPTVGRFKLSEIANMDQTPLPFEFNDGQTYAKTGSKTVWVKEQRSGWDKRHATLQICVHADGLPHTKPLLIFRGKDGLGDFRRKAEYKLYTDGVPVIFNKKAYANGDVLKHWAREEYKWGSAFSPSDNKPRLLVLDAFSAHKKEADEI
ncbi:hypothetical protein LARI1_G009129 [Lachnellula arida]|uniref:DDE-1 domain-containing protein n=1 Tax=Lachnellula arida TaxID=1316785 RepID=A0A8T9B532_9HELO|nr:hypothetical protein LARI1_G009129 [Lachnellula arida]